ncbi:hypothetical protein [Nonomuraea basaltis]|uniref:hypothetical protein n=1 Tax=Nonomuraea basaltis TaxID=2495887 RepID=UPI00110C4638|nr:hypothetical protein [Nonomuraea basaltis]TMR96001.1 hypothetical protein EJK15_25825 [Nonomuraea basaltis]
MAGITGTAKQEEDLRSPIPNPLRFVPEMTGVARKAYTGIAADRHAQLDLGLRCRFGMTVTPIDLFGSSAWPRLFRDRTFTIVIAVGFIAGVTVEDLSIADQGLATVKVANQVHFA